MSDDTRIIARFQPQAWLNDHAYNVDPDGETEFDVTDFVVGLGRDVALAIEDDQWSSDELTLHAACPEWAQCWSGPFYIAVEDSINDYYDNLDGVSEAA